MKNEASIVERGVVEILKGIFSENKGGNVGLAYSEQEGKGKRNDSPQTLEAYLYILGALATVNEALCMESYNGFRSLDRSFVVVLPPKSNGSTCINLISSLPFDQTSHNGPGNSNYIRPKPIKPSALCKFLIYHHRLVSGVNNVYPKECKAPPQIRDR